MGLIILQIGSDVQRTEMQRFGPQEREAKEAAKSNVGGTLASSTISSGIYFANLFISQNTNTQTSKPIF